MFSFAAGTIVAESRLASAMELMCRLLRGAFVNAFDRILRSGCTQLIGQRWDHNAECAAPGLLISDRPSSLPFLGHYCHRDPGQTYFVV
jgi:hypothetical protein